MTPFTFPAQQPIRTPVENWREYAVELTDEELRVAEEKMRRLAESGLG